MGVSALINIFSKCNQKMNRVVLVHRFSKMRGSIGVLLTDDQLIEI